MSAEQQIVQLFYDAAVGLQTNPTIDGDPVLVGRFAPWTTLGNLLRQYPPKQPNDQRILTPRNKHEENQLYTRFYEAEEGVNFFGRVYSLALMDPQNIVRGNAITGAGFEIHGTDAVHALTDDYSVPLEAGRVPDAIFKPLWTAVSRCAWTPLPNGAPNPRLLRREGHPVRSAIYANVPAALEQKVIRIIDSKPEESTARAFLELLVELQVKNQTR